MTRATRSGEYTEQAGDRQRGGGLVEHRSQPENAASEVGRPGRAQAADYAGAVPRGRAEGVERGAGADGGGGGPTAAAPGAADAEEGADADDEPDQGIAGEPGDPAGEERRSASAVGAAAAVGWGSAAGGTAGAPATGVGARGVPAREDSRVGA